MFRNYFLRVHSYICLTMRLRTGRKAYIIFVVLSRNTASSVRIVCPYMLTLSPESSHTTTLLSVWSPLFSPCDCVFVF